MTNWRENRPIGTDPLKALGPLIRDQKVQLRTGLDKHLFWDDSSGLSAGIPRLSDGSPGPGSARAFFGTLSTLSAYRDGALFVRTDSSVSFGQFFAITSVGSGQLGGPQALVQDSGATITQNCRMLVQSSLTTGRGPGTCVVPFPTTYGAPPVFVQISQGLAENYVYVLQGSTTTNFTVSINSISGGVVPENGMFQWLSVGTVAL